MSTGALSNLYELKLKKNSDVSPGGAIKFSPQYTKRITRRWHIFQKETTKFSSKFSPGSKLQPEPQEALW